MLSSYKRRKVESQPLLLAVTVAVGGPAVEAVARHRDTLARLGWEIEPFGDEDVVVRALPALAAGTDVGAITEKLVDDLLAADADTAGDRLAETTLATVACHAAVRVGKRMDRRAAELLLREVGTGRFTASCPHGRPVARTMTRAQLERLFGR
jgi:DNA mismatch repair protein MutL